LFQLPLAQVSLPVVALAMEEARSPTLAAVDPVEVLRPLAAASALVAAEWAVLAAEWVVLAVVDLVLAAVAAGAIPTDSVAAVDPVVLPFLVVAAAVAAIGETKLSH
jgi:hypothetical protein